MSVDRYESDNDDDEFDHNDKSDNNEDKVCLLLRRWVWLGHVLDQMLNHMIIGLVTMVL